MVVLAGGEQIIDDRPSVSNIPENKRNGIEPFTASHTTGCIPRSLSFEQIIDLYSKEVTNGFCPYYGRWMFVPLSNRAMRESAFRLDFVEGNTFFQAYLP